MAYFFSGTPLHAPHQLSNLELLSTSDRLDSEGLLIFDPVMSTASLFACREELIPFEYFWRDHQEWLAAAGYMLRPRYKPNWIPSWLKPQKPPIEWINAEDRLFPVVSDLPVQFILWRPTKPFFDGRLDRQSWTLLVPPMENASC